MFSKQDFQEWGKTDVILFASVATQIRGRKHDRLLGKYGFGGFPSFAILDANGKAITKRVGRSLGAMQSAARAAQACVELEAKSAAGEKIDQSALILAQLGLGRIELGEAKAKLLPLKLNAKRRKEVEAKLFETELEGLRALADRNMDRAGQRVLLLFQAGKQPKAGSKIAEFYDELLLRGAEVEQDAEAYVAVYPRMKKRIVAETRALAKKLESETDASRKKAHAKRLENLKKDLDWMAEQAATFKTRLEEKAAEKAKEEAEAKADEKKKKKRVRRYF